MIGTPKTFWLFHSGMVGLVPEELDKITEYDLARAIHGSGVLLKNFPDNPALNELLISFLSEHDKQQEFIAKWSDPSVFDGFEFRYPGANYPQYINYDTIVALGLAACQINNTFFTGEELYRSLVQLEFEGASSYVSFDNITGTRKSVPFQVDNILMVEKDSDTLGFVQDPAALLDGTGRVTVLKDFVYWDNTTKAPLFLPAMEHNYHLIPTGMQAIGLSFCAISILTSIGWALWVIQGRNTNAVKISQPFFLLQLCLGCLVLASAIIPMSLQEPIPQQGLDIACMSIPWLVFCGYSVSFSALVAKMWRINKIFDGGERFQRVRVTISGASWPLVVLLTLNVILLTIWTVTAPLVWVRIPAEDSVDRFGRPRDSYGRCRSENPAASKILVSLVVLVNSAGLIFTNYQGFKTRRLPTDFNEAFYLAIANACILEVLVLGIPILVLADDSPPASFIVKALMTTVLCMSILLPLFIPKYLQQSMQQKETEQSTGEISRSHQKRSMSFSSRRGYAPRSYSGSFQISGMSGISGDFQVPPSEELEGNSDQNPEDDRSSLLIIRHRDYYIQRNLRPPDDL